MAMELDDEWMAMEMEMTDVVLWCSLHSPCVGEQLSRSTYQLCSCSLEIIALCCAKSLEKAELAERVCPTLPGPTQIDITFNYS